MKADKTTAGILVLLFAAGFLHWIWFLNHGEMSFKAYDWGKEFLYYSVLKQAIATGLIPYHISLAFQNSNRFLAIPETNLSPQVLLLSFMNVGLFVVVNTLLLYSAGFVGCLLLKRRYNLSLLSFAAFFLLFNFNGHIVAHIGVGHSMWVGYFLLPFLFLFMLELLEGERWGSPALKIAFVLFAILLQGSFHLYVWCLIFLTLLLAFNWRYLKPILLAIVLSGVLSAFRLLPALFALWGKKEKFIWSYPTPLELLDGLATIRDRTPDRYRPWGTAGWWEYDIYIGLVGLAVLVGFGLYLRHSKDPELEKYRYSALDLPMFVMTLLSISYFHAFITRIPIPLLKSERVATRFIIIPVVLLALLASIRMEPILRRVRQTFKFKLIAIGALVVMALGFLDHSFLWSTARLDRMFATKGGELTVPSILSEPDGLYKTVVAVSLGITLVALAGLVYLAVRLRAKVGRA